MSIKYGLISETDARTLEKTIDLIVADDSNNYPINVCEIGVYGGDTGRGICEYIKSKGRNYWITGVDSFKDKEVVRFLYNEMIYGNSNEVYNQIPDNSQNLILVDGGHDFPTVVSDYYCYRNKVKRGGFLCFHDTSPQAQGKDWQRKGSQTDIDMFISVRKALNEVGLLSDEFNINSYREHETISRFSWELLFDVFDPNDNASGLCIFKKLY